MSDQKQFEVIIEKSDNGSFVASVPSLPGCYAEAQTFDELHLRIQDAILKCLKEAEEDLECKKRIQDFSSN